MPEKHGIIGTEKHPNKRGGDEPSPYLKDGPCLPAEEGIRYPAILPPLGHKPDTEEPTKKEEL